MVIKSNISFDKDKLANSIKKQAMESVSKQTCDIDCPHCRRAISVPAGQSTCPLCGKEINLTLNFKF